VATKIWHSTERCLFSACIWHSWKTLALKLCGL